MTSILFLRLKLSLEYKQIGAIIQNLKVIACFNIKMTPKIMFSINKIKINKTQRIKYVACRVSLQWLRDKIDEEFSVLTVLHTKMPFFTLNFTMIDEIQQIHSSLRTSPKRFMKLYF